MLLHCIRCAYWLTWFQVPFISLFVFVVAVFISNLLLFGREKILTNQHRTPINFAFQKNLIELIVLEIFRCFWFRCLVCPWKKIKSISHSFIFDWFGLVWLLFSSNVIDSFCYLHRCSIPASEQPTTRSSSPKFRSFFRRYAIYLIQNEIETR